MEQPLFDQDGRLVRTPLLYFERYIEDGMSCILKVVLHNDEVGQEPRTVQFSLTPAQCRDLAMHLVMCADVIDAERPSGPN